MAVIDLGPGDDSVRRKLASAIAAAGLTPVIGDGVEDALAGEHSYGDTTALAVALDDAKRAFGELDCKRATEAAKTAIGIAAARQVAGIAVPELPRAWAYVLLCADRQGDATLASRAATQLRGLGGSPDVDPALLAKYPEIDAVADRDLIDVEITSDVPGATLWVDFAPVGTTPAHVVLDAGEHVIAAAKGDKRGWIAGTAVRSQPEVNITMTDEAGKYGALADQIAGWHGAVPGPDQIEQVLGEVQARVALIRHGDTIEVWGHAGRGEPVRMLGGADGTRSLAETDRALALVRDRVASWNERSPDPDVPLLTESADERAQHKGAKEEPTRWWVYAVIGAAVLAGGITIYIHDNTTDTQRVELHYP
ncbi:MAG TPA: hypothetical protein VLX92_14710 [Kofleriaceae bacterium]|nr:hypothetical protein [Kofleriaceae bacterium]